MRARAAASSLLALYYYYYYYLNNNEKYNITKWSSQGRTCFLSSSFFPSSYTQNILGAHAYIYIYIKNRVLRERT
jgi:hypothetical protein